MADGVTRRCSKLRLVTWLVTRLGVVRGCGQGAPARGCVVIHDQTRPMKSPRSHAVVDPCAAHKLRHTRARERERERGTRLIRRRVSRMALRGVTRLRAGAPARGCVVVHDRTRLTTSQRSHAVVDPRAAQNLRHTREREREREKRRSIARNEQARGGWERHPASSSSLHDQLCQLLISDSTATYTRRRAGWGVSVRA